MDLPARVHQIDSRGLNARAQVEDAMLDAIRFWQRDLLRWISRSGTLVLSDVVAHTQIAARYATGGLCCAGCRRVGPLCQPVLSALTWRAGGRPVTGNFSA